MINHGLAGQLQEAAELGDAAKLAALLAAGADPNTLTSPRRRATALHAACAGGHVACVAVLLAAGAAPGARDVAGGAPAFYASARGHGGCVRQLLAAGADAGDALWYALRQGHVAALRVLLQAAPQAATALSEQGHTPLGFALEVPYFTMARCLLECGDLPPTAQVLAALERARRRAGGAQALPFYALLAVRMPLTPAEWELFPPDCPSLGAALPAVQRRSDAEAALLVRRLPPAERQRLRAAALCLARAQRKLRVALPAELAGRVIAAALAS